METADDTQNTGPASTASDRAHGGAATVVAGVASDHPFGPNAASILATEQMKVTAPAHCAKPACQSAAIRAGGLRSRGTWRVALAIDGVTGTRTREEPRRTTPS
jgi:hypothetical protein